MFDGILWGIIQILDLIMTRDQLLHLAGQWQFSLGTSLAIAKDARTTEDIERLLAMTAERKEKAQTKVRVFHCAAAALIVVGVLLMLACALEFVVVDGPTVVMLAASWVALLIASLIGQGIAAATCTHMVELEQKLAPVVNSSNCKSALEYVQAGKPAVLAWRDLAIAEREVLRVFDVMVMRDLHFATIEAEKKAEQQRENEEACRELYGIVPAHAKSE